LTQGSPPGTPGHSLYVERTARAVLMVDLVDSVRLIETDEKDTVTRWLRLVQRIETAILPNYKGRLIKTLGDGLLLEFNAARKASSAAFDIQQICAEHNANQTGERHFLLRMGIEVTDIFGDGRDIYGHGVNLAARLMRLAGPGEIVVSADVRDQLVANLDADVEDLGDCYVKHVSAPVRAYRIGPAGPDPVIKRGASIDDVLLPAIAVLPFASRVGLPDQQVLGDILAEELIRILSVSQYLHVISRLSTKAFRGRDVNLDAIANHLNAHFVLSGSYHVEGPDIALNVELAEIKSGQVIWSDRFTDKLDAIIGAGQELVMRIAIETSNAIIAHELQRTRYQPLPTLQSYSLLMSAITLMHRMSSRDFNESFRRLELVSERAPRQAIPQAWIAKWYVLRSQQGWSDDPERDSQLAQDAINRALDTDPDSSLALTIDGLVQTHMLKRHDIARLRYEHAVSTNPSNALAWLLKGTQHAFVGDGPIAVENTQRAIRLSPLDPHRYYYDSLAATAYLADHQFERALEFADRSLRANRTHTSSLRAKAIACWQLGKYDLARDTGAILMTLEPNLTISSWLDRSPSAGQKIGEEWAEVLNKIGVPK